MSQNLSAKIRSVALVGHGAAGKTTLAESLLAASGAIPSRGSVEKGNTVCDFDAIEKELGHSLQSALVGFDWEGTRVHLVDTPGYPDFAGQAIGAVQQFMSVKRLPDDIAKRVGVKRGTTGNHLEAFAWSTGGTPLYFQEFFIPPHGRRMHLPSSGRDPGLLAETP